MLKYSSECKQPYTNVYNYSVEPYCRHSSHNVLHSTKSVCVCSLNRQSERRLIVSYTCEWRALSPLQHFSRLARGQSGSTQWGMCSLFCQYSDSELFPPLHQSGMTKVRLLSLQCGDGLVFSWQQRTSLKTGKIYCTAFREEPNAWAIILEKPCPTAKGLCQCVKINKYLVITIDS